MVEQVSRWIMQIAYLISGFIYVHTIEKKQENRKKVRLLTVVFLLFFAGLNQFYEYDNFWAEMAMRLISFFMLGYLIYMNRKLSWFAAYYYTIWAFCAWQLMYEWYLVCHNMGGDYWIGIRSF